MVAQWCRIQLPVQEMQVSSPPGKIPRAGEQLSPCATTPKPVLWSLAATTTTACALPQGKPPKREAHPPREQPTQLKGHNIAKNKTDYLNLKDNIFKTVSIRDLTLS